MQMKYYVNGKIIYFSYFVYYVYNAMKFMDCSKLKDGPKSSITLSITIILAHHCWYRQLFQVSQVQLNGELCLTTAKMTHLIKMIAGLVNMVML